MTAFWAERAWVEGDVAHGVRITASADGVITQIDTDTGCCDGDERLDGLVLPGAVNAHSHAFHRLLRGRTHADGGSFWTWRELMYRESARLDPVSYERIATAVYAEMVAAGWSAVAEFHYVHHAPDARPYDPPHAMELALARAARAAGIRLTLLDTCYLSSGFGSPLEPAQRRFGDADAAAWLARLSSLRSRLAEEHPEVVVGAAVHSVRAVPVDALERIGAELDPAIPLHVHLSEQPGENEACVAATGLTPTALLARSGLLSSRLSAVHATHLDDDDIAALGAAGATIVMCPTTEADLGDGVGPARRLADAGARIALGTDQHAVVDPLLEARALEHGERLASGRRGRFSPAELVAALTRGGAEAVGRRVGALAVGRPCDLLVVDEASARTAGSDPGQLVLSATAQDVTRVIIGGRERAIRGVHTDLGPIGDLWRKAVLA
ncbi:formimidoylglutamate deiminase [Microbacterium sp. VKM Ac-2870]|uniref:formimidoylglutamate deiminase n=1 Tax=Microbacterium sp. VKM Ac-2870 TaxID=2783825 RepID=UPI00188BE608|nr:formimidoylglutamate deiminase [Microbacterium sp. VKM Ac-2870]MBF4562530.1 formimidoylglutamate deiminase [Microbacterium sp. VKM Ac-2870]